MTLQRPMFPPRGAAAEPFLGGADAVPPNLYLPTSLTPEELFKALGRLRSEAEEAVERLIALIDALDADPDAELTGDELEPSLGSPENHPTRTLLFRAGKIFRDFDGVQVEWASGNDDEREGDTGHDDREGDELEHGGDEHDGREPDVDDEMSDTGIADQDGLMEQCPALFDHSNIGVAI